MASNGGKPKNMRHTYITKLLAGFSPCLPVLVLGTVSKYPTFLHHTVDFFFRGPRGNSDMSACRGKVKFMGLELGIFLFPSLSCFLSPSLPPPFLHEIQALFQCLSQDLFDCHWIELIFKNQLRCKCACYRLYFLYFLFLFLHCPPICLPATISTPSSVCDSGLTSIFYNFPAHSPIVKWIMFCVLLPSSWGREQNLSRWLQAGILVLWQCRWWYLFRRRQYLRRFPLWQQKCLLCFDFIYIRFFFFFK